MSHRRDQRSPAAKIYRRLYKTPQWQALRRAQLSKQPLCERCLARGTITPATVVHHTDRHEGNETKFFDASNLASSCSPCHDTIEQGIEARGYEVGVTEQGRPLDRTHPWNRPGGIKKSTE